MYKLAARAGSLTTDPDAADNHRGSTANIVVP
jgi:hypothetical protein